MKEAGEENECNQESIHEESQNWHVFFETTRGLHVLYRNCTLMFGHFDLHRIYIYTHIYPLDIVIYLSFVFSTT